MRIILLEELHHRGRPGQEVEVKPGFARNFLIPQGIAVVATDANRKWLASQKKKIDARTAREREAAAEVAAAIAGTRVEIVKRVGETQTLYGSVTASEIAEALAAKGIEVDRRRIEVGHGIKSIGEHRVEISLHPEVNAELLVSVVAEG